MPRLSILGIVLLGALALPPIGAGAGGPAVVTILEGNATLFRGTSKLAASECVRVQPTDLIETGKVILESGEGFGDPVIIETIGSGDLLGWSWMFPPYVWNFTARATERTTAIFFYGTILREYCERDPSLGYELFKRITPVMMRRLQRARRNMLAIHAHGAALEPTGVFESPFLDQEQDTD